MAVLSIGLCLGTGVVLASDPLIDQIEKDASNAGKGGFSNIVQDVKGAVGVSKAAATNAVSDVGVATTNVPAAPAVTGKRLAAQEKRKLNQSAPTNAPSSGALSSEAHTAGQAIATNAVNEVEGLLGNMLK